MLPMDPKRDTKGSEHAHLTPGGNICRASAMRTNGEIPRDWFNDRHTRFILLCRSTPSGFRHMSTARVTERVLPAAVPPSA